MITRKKNRAVALVVVLSVIVILSLIVVSLTVAMRMERQAAFYFSERARADLMAREGVEMAKIILSDTLGNTNNYVVSMPGRLMVTSNGANGAWTTVNLSSGPAAAAGTGVMAPPDLNKTNKTGDGLRQIDPQGGPMIVPWIYVYQNGDRTTNSSPTISSNNPIIGRYAFWVDDEASRVNLNTAWERNANTTLAHPSQIGLRGLSEDITVAEAALISSNTKIRPIQSVAEIERIVPGLGPLVSSNRFAATVYNHSPALNPWGEPKIILTTQLSNLPPGFTNLPNYTNYFIDILKTNNTDPGGAEPILSTLDINKLDARMKTLVAYLTRTDWPLYPGKSFAQKHKAADPSRVAQIALDIIEYVRAAESTNLAVPLNRIKYEGGKYVVETTGANGLLGTTRRPMITEVGVWIANTANSTNSYEAVGRFEVYLPPHYGISAYPLVGNRVSFSVNATTTNAYNGTITADMTTKAVLGPGEYAVVTTPAFNVIQTNRPANTTRTRIYLSDDNNNMYEDLNGTVTIPPDTAGTNNLVSNIRTAEVDDPRLNKNTNNWIVRPLGSGNTFGGPNSIWKNSPNRNPQQDKEGTTYSDHSLTMPPPKGMAGNERGLVGSVAELGRVSTGFDKVTNTAAAWRTLRLQPTSTGDGDIPDWALLDLFAAPVVPAPGTEQIYLPAATSVAGRINLNTSLAFFSTNFKTSPLQALLQNAAGLDVLTALQNIRTRTLASGGRSFGNTNFYKSVGELSEIQGLSDGGESTEARLIQLASLATVRSGVYRVFCVGQSIKQTPTGELKVNAMKSVETLVESQAEGTKFHSVSWQENPF